MRERVSRVGFILALSKVLGFVGVIIVIKWREDINFIVELMTSGSP